MRISRTLCALLILIGLVGSAQAGSTVIEGGIQSNWVAPSLNFMVDSHPIMWGRVTQNFDNGIYLAPYMRRGADEVDGAVGWNGTYGGLNFNFSAEYWSFSDARRSIEDLVMSGGQVGKDFESPFGTFTPFVRLEYWKPLWLSGKWLPQAGVRHSVPLPEVRRVLQSAFDWTGIRVPPLRLDDGFRWLHDPGVIVPYRADNLSLDAAAVWLLQPNVELALPKIRYMTLTSRVPVGDPRGPNTTFMVEFKITR
jgi:hypothetical protein